MTTKLVLTAAAAALLAGSVFASAQTAQQPGGVSREAPPQGAEDTPHREGTQGTRGTPGPTRSGPSRTTGQAPNGQSNQPGGISPKAPPQGAEDTPNQNRPK